MNLGKSMKSFKKILKSLRIGIPNIFERIGCSLEDETVSQGVSESNMLKYTALIERRTNEILQMHDVCQTKGTNEPRDKKPNPDESLLALDGQLIHMNLINEHIDLQAPDKEKEREWPLEDKKLERDDFKKSRIRAN